MRVRYLLQEAVAEHKATYSEDYIRDFIDVYLKEMKTRENTQEPSTFSGESYFPVLSESHISVPDI
jgi:hypothetical protein